MPLRAPATLSLLLILFCCHCLRADEVTEAAAQLLDVGWRPSASANRRVDQLYETAPPGALVNYAYALVKMRQYRNEEALAAIQSILDDPEQGIHARRLRVWLLTVRRQYSDALAEMERLASVLPTEDTPEAKMLRRELIVFLGRLMGFMRGPGRESLTDFEVESRARRITAPLTDEERELFQEQSRSVFDEYVARSTETDEMVIEETRRAEEEARRRREELAALRKKIDEQLAKLEEQQARLNEEAESELQRIAASDQPLRTQLGSLDSQAAFIRNDMAAVWFDIVAIEEQLAHEDDPYIRDSLLRELARLWGNYNALQNELGRLEVAAAGIHSERAELAAQQRGIQTEYQQRTRGLGQQRQSLEAQLKRADREERKLGENTNIRRAARSQDAKTRALATYLPFPAEAERDRIQALAAE